MNTLDHIRNAERKSHTDCYENNRLFEEGSWLFKPVASVMGILPLLNKESYVRILDLGCGIGRNCIPAAQFFNKIPCHINCVDFLDCAIDQLMSYSKKYHVDKNIFPHICTIEDFPIQEDHYHLILGISSLEHAASLHHLNDLLNHIYLGLKLNGIACLIINSSITEENAEDHTLLVPQFEINLSTETMQNLLKESFPNCRILKSTVSPQSYAVPRDNLQVQINSHVITYIVQKL